MQQKKLILFTTILFLLSSVYLLAIGSKFQKDNFSGDWWAAYFANPKDNSLDFVIENHSSKTDFHYIILVDKEKIKEGDVRVEKEKTENIKPAEINQTGKIVIEITTGNEKKEIYKNF